MRTDGYYEVNLPYEVNLSMIFRQRAPKRLRGTITQFIQFTSQGLDLYTIVHKLTHVCGNFFARWRSDFDMPLNAQVVYTRTTHFSGQMSSRGQEGHFYWIKVSCGSHFEYLMSIVPRLQEMVLVSTTTSKFLRGL